MFKSLTSKFKIPIKYHIVFWISYFLFNFIRWGSFFDDFLYSFKSNLVEFPLNIIITYFVIYYLIPHFLVKKRYWQFILLLLISLSVIYLIRTALIYTFVTHNIWPEAENIKGPFYLNHILDVFIGQIYVIALVATIKLSYDWITEKRKNEELEKMQLKTELDFLKSQIQPHFFFNTLNNLYYLVIEKSPNAPEVVLKLSEIMQYVLYEVKEPRISLIKEINYIYSYLELEKLRYGDKVESHIDIHGNIDDIYLPPLLFLPFIENCFKHGAKDNDRIKVDISFDIQGNFIYFTVQNTIGKQITSTTVNHGIGIQNVERRLQLIYNNRYLLETAIKKNKFKVYLKIPTT